jgi:hypothetical protein
MDQAASRADLRNQSRKGRSPKNRRLLVAIGVGVLVIAIIGVLIAVVAGGGGDNGGGAKEATTVPDKSTNVTLQLGKVSAESAGPPAQLTSDQSQAIMKIVGDYLQIASVQPLRSAKPAGSLSALFDAATLARVTGVDRGVVLDEGLPKVTGKLDVVALPVDIVALADQDGAIVLATVKLAVDTTGVTKSAGGPLHIVRTGDLVFTPDASGAWKITAYNFGVARTGAGLDPTTTTVPTATTAKGPK